VSKLNHRQLDRHFTEMPEEVQYRKEQEELDRQARENEESDDQTDR
jgi:hypothetical protein